MYLKTLSIEGFKSFGREVTLTFPTRTTCIVGPNGSGKSNVTEAFRFVLGEQSMKSMRGKRGEDLIFNGAGGASRAQRASVSIVFDNSNRVLDDAFDEVIVSRTMYRDGSNEYFINGTQVRHRDVVEMLARANIGATGHHIISQGEADRILNSSPEERKEILEDGLGLKLLQYRRVEAEKKLHRARHNIAEADLILREITPHMRYLKRQVDRYETARVIRRELETLYAEYLVRELHYLAKTKRVLEDQYDVLTRRIGDMSQTIEMEKKQTATGATDDLHTQMQDMQRAIQSIRGQKDSVARELGRLEGERDARAVLCTDTPIHTIDRNHIVDLYEDVRRRAAVTDDHASLVTYVVERLGVLVQGDDQANSKSSRRDVALATKYAAAQKDTARLEQEEQQSVRQQEALRVQQQEAIAGFRQSEQTLVQLLSEKNVAEQELADVRHGLATLRAEEEQVQQELTEGAVLIGNAINQYKETVVPDDADAEKREKQKERQRLVMRKKIELETIGVDSGEVVYKEYEDVTERIAFLTRERDDLLASIGDCGECIAQIQKEVDIRFTKGAAKISAEFERFFKILFGGGRASIGIEKRTISRDDEEPEERVGVAVRVSLPRKKIHSLDQLSGGERALVSIALLFAISQVTPPPFLVLDETDAALDEANSRRYAAIIETLAQCSQLILVTHNRETMYCAGALYGVTMNSSGVSTLLSVQFDDAVQVAK